MSAINTLSSLHLQSILNSFQIQPASASQSSVAAVAQVNPQSDSQQLSPVGKFLNLLQDLQQSDPAKYAQLTGKIATSLQSAAQTAQAAGDTGAANQLGALASDFSKAAASGQLPDLQNVAQAIGGGGHQHHGHHAHGSGQGDPSSTDASNDPNSPQNLYLASLQVGRQGNSGQNNSFNAAAIVYGTIAGFGVQSNSPAS
jgi:hypothetical protein